MLMGGDEVQGGVVLNSTQSLCVIKGLYHNETHFLNVLKVKPCNKFELCVASVVDVVVVCAIVLLLTTARWYYCRSIHWIAFIWIIVQDFASCIVYVYVPNNPLPVKTKAIQQNIPVVKSTYMKVMFIFFVEAVIDINED